MPDKLRRFVIDLAPYEYSITCFIGPHKDALRALSRMFDEPTLLNEASDSRGQMFYSRNRGAAIWLPRVPRTPTEYGTLAHEMMHAAWYVLGRWAGMPLGQDSQEAYCHLIGHLVRQFLTKCRHLTPR